jgi:hypothetical protein
MAFFGRVMNYVFNELLVDALANSRAFQRFAVRTDKALREAQASERISGLKQAPTEAAKTLSEFSRSVWESVKAEAEALERKAGEAAGKGKGRGTP